MVTSLFDPLPVLGVTASEAGELLRGRRVTPGEVESVARRHYPWRRHLHDPSSYWVTVSEAARLLHCAPGSVRHLLETGALPYVEHVSGVRLMRRAQVTAYADADRRPRRTRRRG
jgi:hypothetical protein